MASTQFLSSTYSLKPNNSPFRHTNNTKSKSPFSVSTTCTSSSSSSSCSYSTENLRSLNSLRKSRRVVKYGGGGGGGLLSAMAYAITPLSSSSLIAIVEMRRRRHGNVSVIRYGVNPGDESAIVVKADDGDDDDDDSNVLSAMLPFVVAATAIAALSLPSTFTWLVIYPFSTYVFKLIGVMMIVMR